MAGIKKHSKKSPTSKNRVRSKPSSDASLRKHLADLLNGGNAHASIADAVADFSAAKRGAFAPGLPHTGWQLLEHIRLAQWDILEFSRNPIHQSPEFPAGYWPKSPSPADDAAWETCVRAVANDLRAMVRLVNDPSGFARRISLGRWPDFVAGSIGIGGSQCLPRCAVGGPAKGSGNLGQ
jgi:hypothetical protein